VLNSPKYQTLPRSSCAYQSSVSLGEDARLVDAVTNLDRHHAVDRRGVVRDIETVLTTGAFLRLPW
jgi:hypothetical protein